MTRMVDARDVDHAIEQIAATWPCSNEQRPGSCSRVDPCAACVGIGLLRDAPRVDAFEPGF